MGKSEIGSVVTKTLCSFVKTFFSIVFLLSQFLILKKKKYFEGNNLGWRKNFSWKKDRFFFSKKTKHMVQLEKISQCSASIVCRIGVFVETAKINTSRYNSFRTKEVLTKWNKKKILCLFSRQVAVCVVSLFRDFEFNINGLFVSRQLFGICIGKYQLAWPSRMHRIFITFDRRTIAC